MSEEDKDTEGRDQVTRLKDWLIGVHVLLVALLGIWVIRAVGGGVTNMLTSTMIGAAGFICIAASCLISLGITERLFRRNKSFRRIRITGVLLPPIIAAIFPGIPVIGGLVWWLIEN